MKTCTKCNMSGIPDDAMFCPKCGEPFDSPRESNNVLDTKPVSKEDSGIVNFIFCLILCFIFFFIGTFVACWIYSLFDSDLNISTMAKGSAIFAAIMSSFISIINIATD